MICHNCKNPADKKCACNGAFYCSVTCQSSHFPKHKRVCQAVEKAKQLKKEIKNDIKKEIKKIDMLKSAICNNEKKQDVVMTFENKKFFATVVCDGHGNSDDQAIYPKTAAECFIDLVKSGRSDYSNWAKEIDIACANAVKTAYLLTEDVDGVLYKYDNIFHGGTTLSAIIIDRRSGDVIWINAGDSDICFFSESGVETLSSDHSPNAPESWKQLEDLRQQGVNVGTLRWNVKDRKKFFSPIAQQNACPLIFDENGTQNDYAIECGKDVHKTTDDYHVAFSTYQITPTAENKQKLDISLANYQKAVQTLDSHSNSWVNKRLMLSTASGDYGCYLMGPLDCNTGINTELAMVRAIGDRHTMLHGVKCEFSIGRRPLSSFPAGYFFVASDGVWDAFRKENLSEFVLSTKKDVDEILTYVVKCAETKFGKKHDDISFAFIRKS